MPGSDFEWYGDRVAANVHQAAERGTVAVVDAAVQDAREHTPVLTGEARDSLRRDGDGLDIAWGYHVTDEQGRDRGLFIEIGANGKPGAHALRHAADVHYPRLPGEIARRIR